MLMSVVFQACLPFAGSRLRRRVTVSITVYKGVVTRYDPVAMAKWRAADWSGKICLRMATTAASPLTVFAFRR